MTPRHRRTVTRSLLPAVALAVAASLGLTSSSASASPYCGITWGSLDKQSELSGRSELVGVRSGQHACFDRLVLDLSGQPTSYAARYVDAVRHDPRGDVVPLRGGARIQVVVHSPAYDLQGATTFQPVNPSEVTSVLGYQTFRQVAWAGSFEGQTTLGLGVRARLPFRVFVLAGPGSGSRLVLDVAHHW